jgi:hypothetical protein
MRDGKENDEGNTVMEKLRGRIEKRGTEGEQREGQRKGRKEGIENAEGDRSTLDERGREE